MSKPLHILIIEDSEDDALLLIRELRLGGYGPVFERVETPEAMKAALEQRQWDIVISDYILPKFSGLAALAILKESGLDLPFIIVSGNIGEDVAVGAMKAGAHDYIIKGSLKRLVPAVERELREAEARRERRETERRIEVTNNTLKLFTRKFYRKEYLDAVCELVRDWSGCRHVGIRILDRGGNAPFSSCEGYDEAFLDKESNLSIEKDNCICTRIIAGSPAQPDLCAMTPAGSFHSSNAAKFVEELTAEEKEQYRGVCMKYGFQSLAVIPVRYRDNPIGAIHLADEREGLLTQKTVVFLEQLAYIIGEAVFRFGIEDERARLASAVESTAEAVVITDTRGFIQYVNPAFERITGYSRGEAVGRDLHFLDSGRHDQAFYRELRETLVREGVWQGRLINRRKNGSFYFEECTFSPVRNPSGEIVNYVSVKRDVTEKLKLEAVAESVNAMDNIGYVFSGVRHEIGNPINSAKMILSVLQHKLESVSRESVGDYIGRALNEIGRVEHLLKSLKNYNLYETPELENVDLDPFLEKFMKLIAEDFGEKGIALAKEIQPGTVRAHADPRALQQVLLNIVTNAADALAGRDSPCITFSVLRKFGRVLIRIADNGCGMTEEQQRDLFKPFYTSKPRGTGLGLVIVRKTLAKMNGEVEITSRPDQGTAVNIYLQEGRDSG